MKLRTCVTPPGTFVYGVHRPAFTARNLREHDFVNQLGLTEDGPVDNKANFPVSDVVEEQADWIYEIANPLPFRGTTYIGKAWADKTARNPLAISLPEPSAASMSAVLKKHLGDDSPTLSKIFRDLPEAVLSALAVNSTDPADLVKLARLCCVFVDDEQGRPTGLKYGKDDRGRMRPQITRHDLFEALVNNRYLSDEYKKVMVLRPGAQGASEIVGEWGEGGVDSHVFEYLRRNSYIPWGHYAANMADDAVRYRLEDLTFEDMRGLRSLYYQRTYARLADELRLPLPAARKSFSEETLEKVRQEIVGKIVFDRKIKLQFDSTLWGWNYGFDFAPSGYRLHASHQQIHQQFAMVPARVGVGQGDLIPSYACGDLVANHIEQYRTAYSSSFFDDYLKAIRGNKRLDGLSNAPQSLIVYEDDNIMLFVPKAQTSQWELQLMTTGEVGNVLEADRKVRKSLDRGILLALKILTRMGARMVTSIEYSKRFNSKDRSQRLFYSFLPKLPQSMGAFSEAQLRFIMGHYPEDFAAACRNKLADARLEASRSDG